MKASSSSVLRRSVSASALSGAHREAFQGRLEIVALGHRGAQLLGKLRDVESEIGGLAFLERQQVSQFTDPGSRVFGGLRRAPDRASLRKNCASTNIISRKMMTISSVARAVDEPGPDVGAAIETAG